MFLNIALLSTSCFAPRPSDDEDGGQDVGVPVDGDVPVDGGPDDGGSDDGWPGDGNIDPPDAQECQPSDPHLVIGLRSTVYEKGSMIARLDTRLRPCKGFEFDRSQGDLSAVGGTKDGYDLVAFDNGQVFLLNGNHDLWGVEHESGNGALALFTMEFDGREVVGILWGDYYGTDSLDLVELDDGRQIQRFDVSSSLVFMSPTVDGEPSTVAGMIEWDGVQVYRAELHADDLGTIGERQIATPRSGTLNWLAAGSGELLIAADDGVLYWPPNTSDAFLGPIACLWPANRGGVLPESEAEYVSVAHDEGLSGFFLAVVDGDLEGVDATDSSIFRMGRNGECEYLYSAPEDMRINGIVWTGLD